MLEYLALLFNHIDKLHVLFYIYYIFICVFTYVFLDSILTNALAYNVLKVAFSISFYHIKTHLRDMRSVTYVQCSVTGMNAISRILQKG